MRRRDFLIFAVALPTAMRSVALAATNRSTDYLEEVIKEGIVPGAALVTSHCGQVTMKMACGTCCRTDNRAAPLTLDTLHPLYSFSKLITATVVAIMKHEGRLDFSDRVSKHIPEFSGGGKDGITIRHCLTHSAGLANVASIAIHDVTAWNQSLQNLCAATVEWEPGTQTAYHGWSGAFLAAECVRRVNSGAPWAELCRTKFFGPLGAESLSFDPPDDNANVAIVPQPGAEKPLPQTAEAAFGYTGQPGAGCFGTLSDALKVLHFYLQEGVWNSERIISREIFQEMHTVQYAKEIAAARAVGESPRHDTWGLGPLLRGDGPATEAHKWFGFANQASPSVFGHVGISTFIGVGDRHSRKAVVFATTNPPKPSGQTIVIRNKVTDLVFS